MKKKLKKVFLVIPTIRDLDFLNEWGEEFKDCHLIVVEDRDKKSIKVGKTFLKNISHFCWKDIKDDFGKGEWMFSRKNAGIRSYGFWKAYGMGADVVLTLDDDCFPVEEEYVKKHLDNLFFKGAKDWTATYPDPKWMYTRGIPYKVRDKIPVMLSHGLWSGAIDLDAKTEVKLPKLLDEKAYPPIRQIIPKDYFYPMCSMNLAFRRDAVPLMFFPMMGFDPDGRKWGYDRYDDIWAGLFSKKIMDHLGWAVANGSPFVEHRKASDPGSNLKKERKGMKINELLWKKVAEVKLTKRTAKACYIELAEKIRFPKVKYFEKLREAMIIWANLF